LGVGIKQSKLGHLNWKHQGFPMGVAEEHLRILIRIKKKNKKHHPQIIFQGSKDLTIDYHVNSYPSSKIAEAVLDSIWATREWKWQRK